ncbi:hypothetical protein [Candidatus Clostridium helianthi]|jgi:hypothetical protein|uniref:Uncharacterized protein n=1 Tax=Candidatus Clostridium helianthi TaxID=3381660 RepID=A0ABW8SAV3_9CLOT
MKLKKKIKSNEDYKTYTTKLTIISAKACDEESDMDELFIDEFCVDKIKVSFQTESGDIFTQTIKVEFGVNSVFDEIREAISVDRTFDYSYPESFIGKKCNAIIATKSTWDKAFIVAAF